MPLNKEIDVPVKSDMTKVTITSSCQEHPRAVSNLILVSHHIPTRGTKTGEC